MGWTYGVTGFWCKATTAPTCLRSCNDKIQVWNEALRVGQMGVVRVEGICMCACMCNKHRC